MKNLYSPPEPTADFHQRLQAITDLPQYPQLENQRFRRYWQALAACIILWVLMPSTSTIPTLENKLSKDDPLMLIENESEAYWQDIYQQMDPFTLLDS